jgi:hypothetical protein
MNEPFINSALLTLNGTECVILPRKSLGLTLWYPKLGICSSLGNQPWRMLILLATTTECWSHSEMKRQGSKSTLFFLFYF